MKMIQFFFISIILLNISLCQEEFEVQTKIYSDLFYKSYLGNIKEILYPNPNNCKDILTVSETMINYINMPKHNIKFRKNLNEKDNIVRVCEKNILVLNDLSYSDVYNTLDGQLLNTFENNKNSSKATSNILLKNKKTLNLVMSEKRFQIFNSDKILFNLELNENEFNIDYMINEEKEKILFLILNKTNYEIYQLPTLRITISHPKLIKTLSNKQNKKNVYITNDYIYDLNKEKINIINFNDNKENSVTIKGEIKKIYENLKEQNYLFIQTSSNIYIIENDKITSSSEIKMNSKCSLSIQDKSISCIDSSLTIIKLFPNNKKEQYIINHLDNFNNHIIQDISVCPNNKNIITTVINNIVNQFDLSEYQNKLIPISSYFNGLNDIIFSELITFKKIENNKDNNQNKYYTTMENKNLDVSKVFPNLLHLFISDMKEFGRNIIDGFKNLIDCIKDKNFFIQYFKSEVISSNILNYLFIYTKHDELFVLNAINGKILFNKKFAGFTLYKINKLIEYKIIKNTNFDIELLFTNRETKEINAYKYNLLSNSISQLPNNKYLINPKIILSQQKLINSKEKGYVNLSKELLKYSDIPLTYLNGKFSLLQQNNTLYAFKYNLNINNDIIMNIAYNLKFENLITFTSPFINENPIKTYLNEGKIFYKFIDSNIFYVLSSMKNILMITIIHGQTGKIIDERVIRNIDLNSIQYLFEDNWAIISYEKILKGFRRNEIFSFELLKREIEVSLLNLLKKKFDTTNNDEMTMKIYSENNEDVTILSHTFIIPRHIKFIKASTTLNNNSNKFIIIAFDNNMIYLIDRRNLSPRRPIMIEEKGKKIIDPTKNSIYIDNELKPYNALIQLDFNFVLEKSEKSVNDILIGATENESTFVLCSIGNDVECVKVYPDKMYDKLNRENFKAEYIILFTSFIIIMVYWLKKYTKELEFKTTFLQIKNN